MPQKSGRNIRILGETDLRTALACERCRSRKTKCLGNPPDPCRFCLRRGLECRYPEEGRKVVVSESYLTRLRAQSSRVPESSSTSTRAPRGCVNPLRARSPPDRQSLQAPASPIDGPNGDGWWFAGSQPALVRNHGEQQILGSSSALHFTNRLDPASEALEPRLAQADLPALPTRSIASSAPDLPPYDQVLQFYAAQQTQVNLIFAFLEPDDFQRKLDVVYGHNLDLTRREHVLNLCQVLLVIAFGMMYSINTWGHREGPPGFTYFKHVLLYIPAVYEGGSIQLVEVICYCAYYLQTISRHDTAFLYVGLGVRMAVSLGLHSSVFYSLMGKADASHARRVWWSVYGLDRILSVKCGRPLSIRDQDVNTIFSNTTDDESWSETVLRYRTELARILGSISDEIYCQWCTTSQSLLTSITRIFNELSHFARCVPERLRVSPASADMASRRDAVVISILFHSCAMTAARPLMLYVVQQRLQPREGASRAAGEQLQLSTNVMEIITSAISAARSAAFILKTSAEQGWVSTFGYLDGEQAYSSALFLIMAVAAFPGKPENLSAMESIMAVLRMMGSRGNEYIQARYESLARLRTAIDPNWIPDADLAAMGLSPDPAIASANHEQSPSALLDLPSLPQSEPTTDWPSQYADESQIDMLNGLGDLDFDLDVSDDPQLWSDMIEGISTNMDLAWVEAALQEDFSVSNTVTDKS